MYRARCSTRWVRQGMLVLISVHNAAWRIGSFGSRPDRGGACSARVCRRARARDTRNHENRDDECFKQPCPLHDRSSSTCERPVACLSYSARRDAIGGCPTATGVLSTERRRQYWCTVAPVSLGRDRNSAACLKKGSVRIGGRRRRPLRDCLSFKLLPLKACSAPPGSAPLLIRNRPSQLARCTRR